MTQSSHIVSMATASPARTITQESAARVASEFVCPPDRAAKLLPRMYQRTGVDTRGCVVLDEQGAPSFYPPADTADDHGPGTAERMQRYSESASELAIHAAKTALQSVATPLGDAEVTHLITVSCTGFNAPGVDIDLINALPLPNDVLRTHIGFMGCHGLCNAIRVGDAFAKCDPQHRVLVVAVELCSLHFQYGSSSDASVSNALFADGAAALVIQRDAAKSDALQLGAPRVSVVDTRTQVFHNTADLMSWAIGDHGFKMRLSPDVPQTISRSIRPWIDAWLNLHGLNLGDIAGWAVHPGGPRILDAVQESLELDVSALSASREVLRRHGNMSSPTLAFVLERLIASGVRGNYVMLAFGPGLTVEATLLNVGD